MPTFPASTSVASADYNPATRVLTIQFRGSGKHYSYHGVPQPVYDGLLNASSKGRYYDAFIKGRYTFSRY
ncbi:KTSC domain-containing protein [Ameyamaea chiangmaiensis]|uniref:KTSC domain-containing protein n=1 Tax=Ameyamaea chiangmaiensis TaxID=442969 RepID=A0A850P5X2_9PROT|nr:KTSC domain-containing protein [Ameyamaea chiangmaiensis]NVN39328.1 KTSC domain-containing protein [Ameyamaea chiangmaiensis]